MSIEGFETREKRLLHRAEILEAERNRMTGAKTYTEEEVRAHLKKNFFGKSGDTRKCFT